MHPIDNTLESNVYDFKRLYCNENDIIVKILKEKLSAYLIPTILDVGAGIGDIAFNALTDKKVIMVDVNDFSQYNLPCSPNHSRVQCGFNEFITNEIINTVLISHTLQFIDDDLKILNSKLHELSPEFLILVLNCNNDFMNELIQWTENYCSSSNPEYRIKGFPEGYNLIKRERFSTELKCPDYNILAKQVAYLMQSDVQKNEFELVLFLKERLDKPEFIINQSIDIYQKHEK